MINNHTIRIFIGATAILLLVALQAVAQEDQILRKGEVSFLSGTHIYVKFKSTAGIETGDSLFIMKTKLLLPVLIVQNRSSISCLCIPLDDFRLQVSDTVIARIVQPRPSVISEIPEKELPEKDVNEQVFISPEKEESKTLAHQDVSGRISISSYSNFSDSEMNDLHRFRYTFSMKASNIRDSGLSFESYVSFTHKLNQWDVVKENLNNALKIYNLALNYKFNETISLWAGRKINPNIANVGAIDGLQLEKRWNHFFAGIAAGTRPDFFDYGYNINLPEYGAYAGYSKTTPQGYLQSTLAFFEQRNRSKTDRRFVYFQHSNSMVKNLNVFSSVELDLYKLENGQSINKLSLTSLYFSARYYFTRRLSLFGSYDNRKNVVYYETFRNYSEEIVQQAARQGLRFRLNYRPANKIILSVSAGTRFRGEETRETKTFNGVATHTSVPWINASVSVSSNLLQTPYLDGKIFGGRLSKDIIPGKLSSMIHYRHVSFNYVNSGSDLQQDIGEAEVTFHMNKKWHFAVNHESTFQKEYIQNRLYINLRYAF